MKSIGLSNFILNKFCKLILGNSFLGVYPCDAYPIKFFLLNTSSVIFNLSPHYENGSHFVAIYKKGNVLYYFDSFGKKCRNKHIRKFLNKKKFKFNFNRIKLQSPNSYFCGLFCLAFLIFCQKNNKPLFNFVKMFNKTCLNENDVIVTKYILNEIKDRKRLFFYSLIVFLFYLTVIDYKGLYNT